MTSVKQIEANRRNALRSTGPNTAQGKQRASQNAVRHGLTAETVIVSLEDAGDYKAFELAVTSNYDAENATTHSRSPRLALTLVPISNDQVGALPRREANLFGLLNQGHVLGCNDWRVFPIPPQRPFIGTDLERWSLAGIDSIAVDPKGVWIAVWCDDHVLRLLSTTNGAIRDFARLPNDPSSVELAASGDGRHLVVRVDGAAQAESIEVTESGSALRFGSHSVIATPAAASPILAGPEPKRILGETGLLAIGTADGEATLFGKDRAKRRPD